jgi:hypothetical protein
MAETRPWGRTLADFQILSKGEQRLLAACRKGEAVVLGDVVPNQATGELRVRGAFLRFLLLGGDKEVPVHERGVDLCGAFIEGSLDLSGCEIGSPLVLTKCRFDQQVIAQHANFTCLIALDGSLLAKGLDAQRLRCGTVALRNGFKALGLVNLLGAEIRGDLTCCDGFFEAGTGVALRADGALVKGSVHLTFGFRARGTVSLMGVRVGGSLWCMGGTFEGMNGDALVADHLEVAGSVALRDGFRSLGMGTRCEDSVAGANVAWRDGFLALGMVRLTGAQIGGDLACGGARIRVEQGVALHAQRVKVQGNVLLCHGFRARGTVDLARAQIGGNLDCVDGKFLAWPKAGAALLADGSAVGQSVLLEGSFKATAKVTVAGARIGGDFSCRGGRFEVEKGDAVVADGLVVKGCVNLIDGFCATGAVRLIGAQISGDLAFDQGIIAVANGEALVADRAAVAGSVFMRNGFKAMGTVRLTSARVGRDLECVDARLEAKQGFALIVQQAVIEGSLTLIRVVPPARISVAYADAGQLNDELEAWAPESLLDGFRYRGLAANAPARGGERLEWLRKQQASCLSPEGFKPQPWRQLERVLREMGHTEDAKQIGIAFEDQRRAVGRVGISAPGTPRPLAIVKRRVARSFHFVFNVLAGYGYRPFRPIAWMFAAWFVFGLGYWWLALPPRSAMAPSDPLVFQNTSYAACLPDRARATGNWFLCEPLRGEYPTFSPFAFSLDVILPLVDLSQEDAWGAFVPTPRASPAAELFFHWDWGHGARLLIWFQTLFGWICSLMLVAVVSGFARRSEEP